MYCCFINFVIHLVNGAQFLNVTFVAGAALTVISPLTILM